MFLQEPHGVISQKTPFFRNCCFVKVTALVQSSSARRLPDVDLGEWHGSSWSARRFPVPRLLTSSRRLKRASVKIRPKFTDCEQNVAYVCRLIRSQLYKLCVRVPPGNVPSAVHTEEPSNVRTFYDFPIVHIFIEIPVSRPQVPSERDCNFLLILTN
jgi:hypothetical protein